MSSQYAFAAWFFTRALCLIYIVAFLSLATQARGLWGSRGVLPMKGYLQAVEQSVGASRFVQLPTVFWISDSDTMITGAAVAGVLAACLALFGVAQGGMLLLCYILYLSFSNAGQEFLSFQWDALLMEVGFLALFVVPWSPGWTLQVGFEPHWSARWMFYFVLFKLMFLSGVVKIASGDPAWRDMTALSYHYWTQPLPNPVSPFMHALPMWVHRVSTLMTFAIELGFPFLMLWPRTRLVAAAGFLMLSVFIFVTGNYTFFNLLTMALCVLLVPDVWWAKVLGWMNWNLEVLPSSGTPYFTLGVTAVLALFSLYWSTRWFLPSAVDEAMLPAVSYVQTFHLSSPYGLFATMTKTRPEIVIEGSDDGNTWKEYEFRYKPGPVDRAPPVVEPFQPRLDWQLWFAALGTFRGNLWVGNLMFQLFQNSPDVKAFFSGNPFPDEPPRFLRSRLYEYEFTSPGEIFREGKWWKRRYAGEYSPTYQRP
jgi:hypothetical protein